MLYYVPWLYALVFRGKLSSWFNLTVAEGFSLPSLLLQP